MVKNESAIPVPRRNVSWEEKTKNKHQWFKDWASHLKSISNFELDRKSAAGRKEQLQKLYGIYNNQFPAKWFEHVTNPLNTKKKEYTGFPARVRPINYLRTNLDLLLGEFLSRPIKFQIKSENGYSRYKSGLNTVLQQQMTQFFETLQQSDDPSAVEDPDLNTAINQFKSTYRDKLAIRSQKRLQSIIRQYKLKRELLKCKKDYLIAGEAYTYKGLFNNGKFVYQRHSPLDIDYQRSTIHTMVRKGGWVIARYYLSPAEITDMFYDDLKDKDYETIDDAAVKYLESPSTFMSYLNDNGAPGTREVFHYQWRARKKVLQVAGIDPETGDAYEFETDEHYEADESETVTATWQNEIYEIWEIAPGIYAAPRALPWQEDLSYNGRTYSDLESTPISVLEMGLPIQILLMINNFKLESTIVKSKDKIVLLDKHTIPRSEGWTEEKFLYHAEAKGWGFIDRSQSKVDRTYNQYQVLDLTLYERIEQLIRVGEYLKQMWDDLLGISKPRKGQMSASDAVGVTQNSMSQSNIITDMVFYTFEELIEDDLNDLNELARIADSWGTPADSWMLDDFDEMLGDIDPMEASLDKQQVWLEFNTIELQKLERARMHVESMIQQGIPLSQIFAIQDADNMAELRMKLDEMEQMQREQAQQDAEAETVREAELMDLKQTFEEFMQGLKTEHMHEQYDREEDLEILKGSFNTFTFQDGDSNDNGVPDTLEVAKLVQKAKAEDNKVALKKQELEERRETRRAQSKQAKEETQRKREEARLKAATAIKTSRMKAKTQKAKKK